LTPIRAKYLALRHCGGYFLGEAAKTPQGMAFSTLLLRAGLLACALLGGQLSAHAQSDTEQDAWDATERAKWKADSLQDAEVRRARLAMREEMKRIYTFPDSAVYIADQVDQLPQQPGGGDEQAIIKYIQKGFRYPELALKKRVGGRAIVSFVVNENGEIIRSQVVSGLGYGIDEALIKAITNLSKFIPAKRSGQAVRFGYTLPITLQYQ
jgi:TonB family protein